LNPLESKEDPDLHGIAHGGILVVLFWSNGGSGDGGGGGSAVFLVVRQLSDGEGVTHSRCTVVVCTLQLIIVYYM
jgi:hypothetical protein